MIATHVDLVGTYPLQGEDFGEDLHDSGGSDRAVPDARPGGSDTRHG